MTVVIRCTKRLFMVLPCDADGCGYFYVFMSELKDKPDAEAKAMLLQEGIKRGYISPDRLAAPV